MGATLFAVAPSASAAQIGTLTFGTLNNQDQTFSVTTSGACPAGGTNLVVAIVGGNIPNPDPTNPPLIQGNLAGTSVVGGISSGAFSVPLAQTLAGYANSLGLAGGYLAAGTYTTTLTCRGKFDPTSVGEYVGQFTVTGSGASSVVTPVVPTVAQNTTTVVTTDAASDTAQWGSPVTVTATVATTPSSANVPTGSVQFKADGANVGSAVSVTNGVATTVISDLSLGAHTLSAVYTPTGSFNTSTSANKSITIALTAVPTAVLAPSLTGARVGSTATCLPGTWTLATSYRYEFLLAGSVVQNSTTVSTRPVTAADFGKTLACRVTAINPNGSSTPVTTAAVAVAAGPAAVATTKPRIVGTAAVGRTLTASKGVWSPSAVYTYYYIWKRGATIVKQGTTATSYRASSLDKGKKLTLTVQARRTGYATGTATSAAVTVK